MTAATGRFTRDTLGLAASTYAARAVVLARGLVAAAVLGPAGFGGWNVLSLVLDYGSYAGAGAPQGLDLTLPAAAARDDRERQRRLLSGAWAVTLAGAAAFASVAVLLFAIAPAALGGRLGGLAIGLALAAVVLQHAIQLHAAALRARGRFGPVSASGALQALLGGGLGIALVAAYGVTGLIAGWVAGTLAALIVVRAAAPDVPLAPRGFGEGPSLARAGAPVFAFFLASLALRSVDRLAFAGRADLGGLGHYSLGLLAAGLVLYVPEAAGAVLAPRVAAMAHGARDPERTRLETARAQRMLAIALPAVAALGVLVAPPVVAALLPGYVDALPVLRVLAVAALVLAAGTVPGYYLLASGRAPQLARFGAATAIVAAGLVVATAARDPRPVAIAVAAGVGYALFAGGIVALSARELGGAGGARAFVIASFVPALWGGGAALALAAGAGASAGDAALRVPAWLLLYAPVPWWFGREAGLPAWLHPRSAPSRA